jgi:hypothetical protein
MEYGPNQQDLYNQRNNKNDGKPMILHYFYKELADNKKLVRRNYKTTLKGKD